MHPPELLRADIDASMAAVRLDLGEQSRRRHEILHIFDESPEIDVALARTAPRTVLAVAMLLFGFAALALLWRRVRRGRAWKADVWLAPTVLGQLLCAAWLAQAQYVDRTVAGAVVVEEDAPLTTCTGVSEAMGLPEGLEVRKLRELADGRIEVRLANGRQGCLDPKSVQIIQ